MIICFKKNMQMHLSFQNGKRKDSKNYAVSSAFRKLIDNLEQLAYAEFQKTTWKMEKLQNVKAAVAKGVQAQTDYLY